MKLRWRNIAAHALSTSLALPGVEPIYAQMGARYQEQKSNEEKKEELCHSIYKDAQFSRYVGVKEWRRYYVEPTGNRSVWDVFVNSGGGCSYTREGSLSIEDDDKYEHQWQIEGRKLVRYIRYSGSEHISRHVMGTARHGYRPKEIHGRPEVTNYDTVFPNGIKSYGNIFK